jgi:hypothetical protein
MEQQDKTSDTLSNVSGTLDAINSVLGLLRMAMPDTSEDGLVPEEGAVIGDEGVTPESGWLYPETPHQVPTRGIESRAVDLLAG